MAIKLDGKKLADKICKELKEQVSLNKTKYLTIVTTGDDEASKVYVRQKVKRTEEIGIDCEVQHFDKLTVRNAFDIASKNKPVILQLPAEIRSPFGTKEMMDIMTNCIPLNDVDGFGSENCSRLYSTGTTVKEPCTPAGIIRLLKEYNIQISGKTVLIINRSEIVGKPLAHMLMAMDATVIIAHSKTPKNFLKAMMKSCDIIVAATGQAKWIKPSMIAVNQVLIDVSMCRDEDGKLCGDFDPECYEKCYAYTPVPGGVGPMTVAMLMYNVCN